MVTLSMSPTNNGSPTGAATGGTPGAGGVSVTPDRQGTSINGSPSPQTRKVGWDGESLPSPAYGVLTGSPSRPAVERPSAGNEMSGPEGGGGPPAASSIPTNPRVANTTTDGADGLQMTADELAEGSFSGGEFNKRSAETSGERSGDDFGARTASPSPPARGEMDDELNGSAHEKGESGSDRRDGDLAREIDNGTFTAPAPVYQGSLMSPPGLTMQPPSACSTPPESPTGKRGGFVATGFGAVAWSASSNAKHVAHQPTATLNPVTQQRRRGRSKDRTEHCPSTPGNTVLASPRLTPAMSSFSKRATRAGLSGSSASAVSSPSLGIVTASAVAAAAGISPRASGVSPRATYPEGLEWWNELELSPSKVEMPGLQRWRDSRRPTLSRLPSSGHLTSSDTSNSADPDSSPSPSHSSTSKLSRSYVTLLAAAAEEARALSPLCRSRENGKDGRVAATELGQATRTMESTAREREMEEVMRRLEAENLRLRFRVADLEGQVSVMEDELDRRGGRIDDTTTKFTREARLWSKDNSDAAAASSPRERGFGAEPVLSPRGRGYLARLVVEVCEELDQTNRRAIVPREIGSGGAVPRSERLCKVLPKVMDTAIKGVRDLDEQVFEQMMQTAAERMPPPPPPPPPGTPARRLSSCVVARDGGAEFFAQSPAPGRPASFFRLGEAQTPRRASAIGAGSAGFGKGSPPESARERRSRSRAHQSSAASNPATTYPETPSRSGGPLWGAGEWWAATFTPTATSASPRARGATENDVLVMAPPPPPAQTTERQDMLSFEGSAEEVLRYTIVAKSYLIRSRSRRHEDGNPSPSKIIKSPGGTETLVVEGDENDVRAATKELLDLKTKYMAATQHWLKTDIVNDEELRMIRAQVFEAIQRKRSELHREAAAVLRAERTSGSRGSSALGSFAAKNSKNNTDGDISGGGISISAINSNDSMNADGERDAKAAAREDEANRTITMLGGTAELLKFSRLLLLLSEAISVSASVSKSSSGKASGSAPRALPATIPESGPTSTPGSGSKRDETFSKRSPGSLSGTFETPARPRTRSSPVSGSTVPKATSCPLRPTMRDIDMSPE